MDAGAISVGDRRDVSAQQWGMNSIWGLLLFVSVTQLVSVAQPGRHSSSNGGTYSAG